LAVDAIFSTKCKVPKKESTVAESPHILMQKILAQSPQLTPKGRALSELIIANLRKVVFMTIRELAEYCGVSEATVVRFACRLGFKGYNDFQQALRDMVDVQLTLLERLDLTNLMSPHGNLFSRVVFEEIDNLKHLHESLDLTAADRVVNLLHESPQIYVIGSRLSYTFAYYMGWSLSKIRPGVQILKSSDNTTLDWLAIAPRESLVVLLATSRYPNDMIRTAKTVRRQGKTLVVIADSASCPLVPFSNEHLIAPSRHIPVIGHPAAISCLVNFLIEQLASRQDDCLKAHQTVLERTYLENDLLFNLGLEKKEKPHD
jgi:DNA-binding MurR/RpiR family transcriptional regulator